MDVGILILPDTYPTPGYLPPWIPTPRHLPLDTYPSETLTPWIPTPMEYLPPWIPTPQKGHGTRDISIYPLSKGTWDQRYLPPEGTWSQRYLPPPPPGQNDRHM